MNTPKEIKRTTIYLPDDLLIRAKIVAVKERRTLTDLIREGLTTLILEKEKTTKIKR